MSFVINNNLASLNAQRHLKVNDSELATSMERLSSGKRINSSMDDAAGLSIVNRFIAKSATNSQAIRNANDAISVVHIAEGALDSVQSMLTRVRELTVQAANDNLDANAKQILEDEAHQLMYEIDRIKDVTSFNGVTLLDGSFTDVPIYLGSENTTSDLLLSINGSTTKRLFDIPEATFENGTFSGISSATDEGGGVYSIDGWTINTNQIDMGTDKISGFDTPEPAPAVSTDGRTTVGDTFSVTTGSWGGDFEAVANGIRLKTGEFNTQNGAVFHGPYVVSDEFMEISAGAEVSFDWSAVSGGDAYDIYGYLLKDDGTTVELIDTNGKERDTGSDSVSKIVTTSGNYKFVFVAGTFDESFGTYVGSSFDIKNVSVTGNVPLSRFDDIIDYSSSSGISTSFSKIDEAISTLLADRALLGAQGNRIEHALQSLYMKGEKYAESTSRINDADYAVESASLAKSQVLSQAATAMLAQANASTVNVMNLLK